MKIDLLIIGATLDDAENELKKYSNKHWNEVADVKRGTLTMSDGRIISTGSISQSMSAYDGLNVVKYKYTKHASKPYYEIKRGYVSTALQRGKAVIE